MATTALVTWNLQGSHGLDVAGVAGVLGRAAPHVVVLQEVQRGQARDLADALGMRWCWTFKHWPLVTRPEGAAVLSTFALGRVDRLVLRRSWWWSWRRRIALAVTVTTPGGPLAVLGAHLSPGSGPASVAHRRREAAILVGAASGAVIAGDLNEQPGDAALAALLAAGWQDAWATAHPGDAAGPDGAGHDAAGATNWTPGPRQGRPPTQRLDYVLVPAGWSVEACDVLGPPDELEWFAARSDHLPLLARLVAP